MRQKLYHKKTIKDQIKKYHNKVRMDFALVYGR